MALKSAGAMCEPETPAPAALFLSIKSAVKNSSFDVFRQTRETIGRRERASERASRAPTSPFAGQHRSLSSVPPPSCVYPHISRLYVLLYELGSNTWDQFKYWRFPARCCGELEHTVKHKKKKKRAQPRVPFPLFFFFFFLKRFLDSHRWDKRPYSFKLTHI